MATLNGTEGNDTLIGGTAADDLHGFGGNDFLQGGDGADTVLGDAGNDTLSGNSGNDWVRGGTGNDQVAGGGGQDTFAFHDFGTANADTLTDFSGSWDHIGLDVNAFTALGSSLGDFAAGDARFRLGTAAQDADDRIIYNQATGQLWYDADGNGAGAAQLIATLSNRPAMSARDIFTFQSATPPPPPGSINGTEGNDTLIGTAGNDTINGFGGNDTLLGNEGSDSLDGGAGNDLLNAYGGQSSPRESDAIDTLNGGLGDDNYLYWHGGAIVIDPGGLDTVHLDIDGEYTMPGGIEFLRIIGSSNDNVGITGNELDNFVDAGSPRDRIHAGAGNDTIYGDFGNDDIFGEGGNDVLDGQWDRDLVDGGAGNDTLYGGSGLDTLTGSSGADVFAMAAFDSNNYDEITDFGSGIDRIQLDGEVFTAIGASGGFVANDPRFHVGWSGIDSDVRVIYDPASGFLFYDPDGSGVVNGSIFAAIGAGSAITATDFTVINGQSADGQVINGTSGNDQLIGGSGNDTINGLGGDDTLSGVGGDDSLSGGDGSDLFDGGAGADTMLGGAGNNTFYGRAGNDLMVGGAGNETFYPGEGNDRIETGDGDSEVIVGEVLAGLDQSVEYGNDTFIGGAGTDVLEFMLHGDVTVDLRAGMLTGGSQSGGGSISLSGFDAFGFFGDFDVTFTADDSGVIANANGAGEHTLIGGAGADQFYGGDGRSLFIGGEGADTMFGGSAATFIFNTPARPGIADRIGQFDTGIDSLHFAGSVFTALGAEGRLSATDERFYAADGATQGHDATDRLIYNTLNGDLWYDADGSGTGASILVAHLPRDTGSAKLYTVNASDIWVDGAGPSTGRTINGTSGNDFLVGGPGADTINGFAGNDTIDGLDGADSMVGGDGDDLYLVEDFNDIIVETQNGGIDEVRSSAEGYVLPDWVNNLTLIDLAQNGAGNAIANLITGNDQANSLSGGGGNDTLIGGGVAFDAGPGHVNWDSFLGGDGDDSMVGSSSEDHFNLTLGATTAYGHDTIIGGAGFDWLEANGVNATGGVVVDLGAGTVSGGMAGSSAAVSGIEAVYGSPFADRLTGDAANNQLVGGDGNDTLNGAGGNDTLESHFGTDTFLFTAAPGAANADVVADFVSGMDEIRLDASAMTALGASGDFIANDPRFRAGTAAQDADDRIIFNSSTGQLWYDADGTGAGAQQLIATLQTGTVIATDFAVDNGSGTPPPPPPGGTNGTEGNDTMIGTAGSDTLNGLGGNDFMQGNDSADTLRGGAGNDTMGGNAGVDWIEGGTGNDRLTGGSAQDAFVFREFGAANADTLTDFGGNGWDSLRMDNAALTGLGGDGRFASGDARFRAGTAAADADDRIVWNSATGQVWYDADGNGAGAAQLVATLQAGATLVASDIWVI